MGYKHYTINIIFTLLVILLLTAAITACLLNGVKAAMVILLAILLLWFVVRLWILVKYPLRQILYFLLSLRCGERMIRFPETKDRMLNEMHQQMNDIVQLYLENKKEIETKKKYYDRILRIMTHEIRNTITPIVSLSDYYIQSAETVSLSDIKEGMQIINNQSNNLKEFLDSYHALTHLPEPNFKYISIPELFNEIWQLLRNEPGGKCIKILVTNITIHADPMQMQLLLSNLLRNAMHAISGCDDGEIEMRASISNKRPYITVTDNGCGIPPERIKDIFLPFYTTKENGNGIGLALCRQIMQLHGGELTVESNTQKRITTFMLTFPEI